MRYAPLRRGQTAGSKFLSAYPLADDTGVSTGGALATNTINAYEQNWRGFILPNIVEFGNRGTPGTWGDFFRGAGKAVYNMAADINDITPRGMLRSAIFGASARFGIADQELGGAATAEGAIFLAGVFKAGATAASTLARRLAARGGAKAFHHTADEFVKSIMQGGLRPGSYATPKVLSPLQAKIELALPGNLPRNAVLEIDLAGLRKAGYQIPDVTRVSSYKGLAGGGYEMQFPYAIPPEFLRVIQ